MLGGRKEPAMNMLLAWKIVIITFLVGCALMLGGWLLGKYTDHYIDRKEAEFAQWDEDNADIWYDGFSLEEFDMDLDELAPGDQAEVYKSWK
jgi:hypothetical protein